MPGTQHDVALSDVRQRTALLHVAGELSAAVILVGVPPCVNIVEITSTVEPETAVTDVGDSC